MALSCLLVKYQDPVGIAINITINETTSMMEEHIHFRSGLRVGLIHCPGRER